MKKALRDKLLTILPLIQVIGKQVYTFPIPPSAIKPYVVLACPSSIPSHTLKGGNKVYKEIWRIDVCSEDEPEANLLVSYIEDGMDMKRGTWGNMKVHGCVLNEIRDLSELENSDNDKAIFRKNLEFSIIRQLIYCT